MGDSWRDRPLLQQFLRPQDDEWNFNLYMNDIELVRLNFFRGERYQDYFRYLDSLNGFFNFRWGDHALRTIAVGLYLEPEQVMQMRVPYAHQGYCQCQRGWRCHTERQLYENLLPARIQNVTAGPGRVAVPETVARSKPAWYRDNWRVCAPSDW